MRFLFSATSNPHFNLAAEEYLMRHTPYEVVFLYINRPSIIVGKHQNTLAEINRKWVDEHRIPVIRRLSGGGTVYHDEGNINFCFIRNTLSGKQVNFRVFVEPIIQYLHSLGLEASMGSKNELRIEGKKISGNAEHVFKNRVMHHGTLLYDSDLTALEKAIQPPLATIDDKAVKSNRSEVANISEFLSDKLETDRFAQHLFQFLQNFFPQHDTYHWSSADLEEINRLMDEKYRQDYWNFHYSPDYTFVNDWVLDAFFHCQVDLSVSKGIIKKAFIGGSQHQDVLQSIAEALTGVEHQPEAIRNVLNHHDFKGFFSLVSIDRFIELFF